MNTKRFPLLASLALLVAATAATTLNARTTAGEQQALTPRQVLKDLMAGNARFVEGALTTAGTDIVASRLATADGQYPKAVILSCLDSRVPVELVFDQQIGDLFVGRVAGNIENEDQLGSMEFATKLAGAKLVMVLGHSDCGAVKGACADAQLGNLTGLLAKIKPAIENLTGFEDADKSSDNPSFVAAVVEANVRQTVEDIRTRSEILNQLEKDGVIMIVGGVYDLESGAVTLLD